MTAFAQINAVTRLIPGDSTNPLVLYWPVGLVAILGFLAIYLLLPRAHGAPQLGAYAAGVAAILAVGLLAIRYETASVETVLFCAFSGLALIFGGLMLSQSNPVHAALSFAMVVLSTCGLFLLQGAPFLMAATIIIYAGAIVVTFLFVIMLAMQTGSSNADQRSREPFLASAAGFILLGCLLCILQNSYATLDPFVARAQAAARETTVAGWRAILGSDDSFFTDFRKAVQRSAPGRSLEDADHASAVRKDLAETIEETQRFWNRIKPSPDGQAREAMPQDLNSFQAQLASLVDLAKQAQLYHGTLQPAKSLPLSSFAGRAVNRPVPIGTGGQAAERLPAANVAGIGRTLFTDYLLAVELGGALLLVAVVGAIAIAGRRPEGLR